MSKFQIFSLVLCTGSIFFSKNGAQNYYKNVSWVIPKYSNTFCIFNPHSLRNFDHKMYFNLITNFKRAFFLLHLCIEKRIYLYNSHNKIKSYPPQRSFVMIKRWLKSKRLFFKSGPKCPKVQFLIFDW